MRAGAVRACVLRGEGPAKSIALGIELCKCASCMLPTASYFGRVCYFKRRGVWFIVALSDRFRSGSG